MCPSASTTGWSAHLETVIRPGVEGWAAARTKLDAARDLAAAGVAAGPVNGAADIAADPHVRERAFVHEFERQRDDAGAPVRVVGNPLANAPQVAARRWPTLGEHTDAVLAGRLGLTAEQIADLRARKVVA